ncbi:hypothetical protein Dimus_018010 [Dionaea muscipula]
MDGRKSSNVLDLLMEGETLTPKRVASFFATLSELPWSGRTIERPDAHGYFISWKTRRSNAFNSYGGYHNYQPNMEELLKRIFELQMA